MEYFPEMHQFPKLTIKPQDSLGVEYQPWAEKFFIGWCVFFSDGVFPRDAPVSQAYNQATGLLP
jgi:hypothetical protein